MSAPPSALAAIAVGSMCVAAGLIRSRAHQRHQKRLRELDRAAELLEFYVRHLETFLDDPAAPAILRAIVFRFGEFMADRAAVSDFAAWLVRQPMDPPAMDAETREAFAVLDELQRGHPELACAFSSALVCGAFGAALRWPESAACLESRGPTIVADGRREVAAVVRAAKMRSQPLFDLAARQHAMA